MVQLQLQFCVVRIFTRAFSNTMFIRCALLLLFLSCVRVSESKYDDVFASDLNKFSLWPSYLNAAKLLRSRRASSIASIQQVPSEGQPVVGSPAVEKTDDSPKAPEKNTQESPKAPDSLHLPPVEGSPTKPAENNVSKEATPGASQGAGVQPKVSGNNTDTTTVVQPQNTTLNATIAEKPKILHLNNPGVVKRGLIVFGGFALMAVAYFIFYRRKNKNNDMSTSLGMNDSNQFRYGMLQNEDMKDNIESSRIPLTMDSEDEVDDDLEIFDLVQKKKSLSYVNLQQNDEDIVLSTRDVDIEGDNLLLDIEDASADTLINWTNNGNKSIL